jgi:alkanesulfonate monooxygenase SsuD/methylene tetrahydromethanopterin reductase-like flavin-dependent oxidoreductase (luciferase family)
MPFERHHVERLCIVGTPEECAARLRAYGEAGAEHVALNPAVEEPAFLEQVRRLRSLVEVGAAA